MNTLARTLGETWHMSPLARKLRRCGLPTLETWMQLAVQRGCTHYQTGADPVVDPGPDQVSNEELAVALLLGENVWQTRAIRIAGQLIAGVENPDRLLRLGILERVSPRIRYIAECASAIEPENDLWRVLCDRIPPKPYAAGLLPHRDRFTTEAPLRRGELRQPRKKKWLRPSPGFAS